MKTTPARTYEKVFFLRHAWLELTRECNLRCVYCGQSQPDFERYPARAECIGKAVESLGDLLVGSVDINGHGETTMLAGWHQVVPKLRAKHLRVSLTSNFARPFDIEDLEAMVQLSRIAVSVDTDDPDLLRRTRRPVSLETIMDNIGKVRQHARRRKTKGPTFAFNCVVHSQNVMHLDRFVAFGLRNGIREFSFCNLRKPPDLEGADNVDHVSGLPRDLLAVALEKIDAAERLARSGGAKWFFPEGLKDSITKAKEGRCEGVRVEGRRSLRFSGEVGSGETRDCLDPWFFCVVRADGVVSPCCGHGSIGSIQDQTLLEVLNNEQGAQVRRGLISGDLDPFCRSCSDRRRISREAFLKKILLRVPPSSAQAMVLRQVYRLHMVANEVVERFRT